MAQPQGDDGNGNPSAAAPKSAVTAPPTGCFSSIILTTDDTIASMQLMRTAIGFRRQLINGTQKDNDVKNFVLCLPNRSFYKVVASIFPQLRGEDDEYLFAGDGSAVLSMPQAAQSWIPAKGGALSDDYELTSIRSIMNIFVSVVIENFNGFNKDIRVAVANACIPLFGLIGLTKLPALLKAARITADDGGAAAAGHFAVAAVPKGGAAADNLGVAAVPKGSVKGRKATHYSPYKGNPSDYADDSDDLEMVFDHYPDA